MFPYFFPDNFDTGRPRVRVLGLGLGFMFFNPKMPYHNTGTARRTQKKRCFYAVSYLLIYTPKQKAYEIKERTGHRGYGTRIDSTYARVTTTMLNTPLFCYCTDCTRNIHLTLIPRHLSSIFECDPKRAKKSGAKKGRLGLRAKI